MYCQGVKKQIVRRSTVKNNIQLNGIDPLLTQILVARGVTKTQQMERSLSHLPSPWLLSGMEIIVKHLIHAIKEQKKVCIVADFDADGATSCAVALRGLRLMGLKNICFVVPNRFEYGYGLTPEIVELVSQQNANYILTVDNGISSIDGVLTANEAGIQVLITDHHLPGNQLPQADAIVNPNQVDDDFPSKDIAGVGVIFYVLMALRSRLRELNWFESHSVAEPNLAQLLDFVALGTIADVVALDQVNRILVHQGIQRIRSGKLHVGIAALIKVAGKQAESIQPSDLGFALAPRLNAAGRMDDMSLGIQCLMAEDEKHALALVHQLDELNQERKEIEAQMKQEAIALLNEMHPFDDQHMPAGICLFEEYWHQGVIGILASRIKDRLHRPVVAFAAVDKGEIKGSARSIPGIHIRDVLSEIAASHPQILSKFGGHAMAAGMTIKMHDYPAFALAFDEAVSKHLDHVDLEQKVVSDGQLEAPQLTLNFTEMLKGVATWGQAFPEPVFDGVFDVVQCRIVGKQHLKFVLRQPNSDLLIDAIGFFIENPESWQGVRTINAAYKLDINLFRGNRSLQLMLEYFEKIQ